VVSAYEHDRRDPSVATLQRLLGAANTTLELRTSTVAATVGAVDSEDDRERGELLVDALLLADAIPTRPRGDLTFPRIGSRRSTRR
jgi:transcriptional regulator with XRE-family HTH domain